MAARLLHDRAPTAPLWLELARARPRAHELLRPELYRARPRARSLLRPERTFDSGCAFLLRWYVLDIMPAPSPDDWWYYVAQQIAP